MITRDPRRRMTVTRDRPYRRSRGSETANAGVAESPSASDVVRRCARSAAVEEATTRFLHLAKRDHATDYPRTFTAANAGSCARRPTDVSAGDRPGGANEGAVFPRRMTAQRWDGRSCFCT